LSSDRLLIANASQVRYSQKLCQVVAENSKGGGVVINRSSTESERKTCKAHVDKSNKVQQYGISVTYDVERKLDRKTQKLQKDLENKNEDKFDQIFKKLNSKSTNGPRENYRGRGRGKFNEGKGKFKRGQDNREDKMSESADLHQAYKDPKC
jgi:hypothetical protein